MQQFEQAHKKQPIMDCGLTIYALRNHSQNGLLIYGYFVDNQNRPYDTISVINSYYPSISLRNW